MHVSLDIGVTVLDGARENVMVERHNTTHLQQCNQAPQCFSGLGHLGAYGSAWMWVPIRSASDTFPASRVSSHACSFPSTQSSQQCLRDSGPAFPPLSWVLCISRAALSILAFHDVTL